MTALDSELPVFDRRDALPAILNKGEWAPARTRIKTRGVAIRIAGDPRPSFVWDDAKEAERELWRRNAAATYASQWYDGQAANDNQDWPLQKLLRTEKNDHCLALAERYRALHDIAERPTALVGREPVDLYIVQNIDKDGKKKGPKVITGKKAMVDTQPSRNRAAPVPKEWTGDAALIATIDARRELAFLRGRLGYVPAILDAFEWSVVDGLTLEEIGKKLGAGSKGAKGEARARIFDGFGILDRYWRQGIVRKAA